MPFIGEVSGRPSVLSGDPRAIIDQANALLEREVDGFDLLGYRYTGDAAALNQAVVSQVDAPICIAGSVNTFARLDEVKKTAPWACTVGAGFVEHQFGDDYCDQIERVCHYLNG